MHVIVSHHLFCTHFQLSAKILKFEKDGLGPLNKTIQLLVKIEIQMQMQESVQFTLLFIFP